jgi:hypothetical protein
MNRMTALLLLLLAVSTACVQPATRADFGHSSADYSAMSDKLAAKGTANSLATAALLKRFGTEPDKGSYELAAKAVALAPDRTDLAWLEVRFCVAVPGCNLPAREENLRRLDPANSAGWLGSLNRALAKGDTAGVDAALAGLGDAGQFNVYFDPLVVIASHELISERQKQLGSLGHDQVATATMTMIGVVAASVLPGFQAVNAACSNESLENTPRIESCRKVGQAFEHGDTYIVEGLGLSLQQHLWPEDSPEAHGVKDRLRVIQYRLEEYSRLPISSPRAADLPADYLDVLQQQKREQDASLVYFKRAGVPFDPPADWVTSEKPRFH